MPSGIFTLKQQEDALNQYAWTNQKTPAVDYLVVAGGGGGAGVYGAGGAGGLLQGSIAVATGTSITVTVGAGGSGSASTLRGNSGNSSVFGSISTTGGGGAGADATGQGDGLSGGSGGGAGEGAAGNNPGGQGVAGQGNAGGNTGPDSTGAGGGGAGSKGLNNASTTVAGSGGAGIASDISGTRTAYAGGGGGGGYGGSGVAGVGGAGGGGNGGAFGGNNAGGAGTANTGGGGGGGSFLSNYGGGGAGGSGIVIISYPDTYQAAASTTGSPTVGTSGSGSISFNGSSQYMRYGNQSGFALGAGDFTLELFVYLNSLGSGDIVIFDARPQGTQGVYPTIYFNSSTLYWFVNSGLQITGTGALAINTWYHIAVSRIGTSTKMFVNGSQVGSTYTDSNNYLVGSERPAIATGGYSFGSNLMNGYISNIRIVKGTGLYSSNFTAPAAPLTPVSGTSFLLNTVSGAYTADSSGNGYAPVATGTPAWNSLSPFATGLGYKNRVYTWTSSGSITF